MHTIYQTKSNLYNYLVKVRVAAKRIHKHNNRLNRTQRFENRFNAIRTNIKENFQINEEDTQCTGIEFRKCLTLFHGTRKIKNLSIYQ